MKQSQSISLLIFFAVSAFVLATPREYSWTDVNGRNFVTMARNQHVPRFCNSDWALATTSSIADRLRILRNNAAPEILLSPQALINSGRAGDCSGGDIKAVYEIALREGLVEDTCQNYEGTNPTPQKLGTPLGQCENCIPGTGEHFLPGTCSPVLNYSRYFISEYGFISGADVMKEEILLRGPITCAMQITDNFKTYSSGIFSEITTHSPAVNAYVSVVGWGVQKNGEEYWIVRNSWGQNWGENGMARLLMHKDNLGIETNCSYAIPVLPSPKNTAETQRDPKSNLKYFNYKHPDHISSPRKSHVISPLPHTILSPDQIPSSFDIRNVSGVSYASPNVNQHNPNYCGSCWAMSAASALSDRFNFYRKNAFPEVLIAAQVFVNCVKGNSSNGCNGGQPDSAYDWVLQNGVPDATCMNFQAMDMACTPENICRKCDENGCSPETNYHKYEILEHGWVTGELEMMAEISTRGPVACSIAITEELEEYKSGVFVDHTGARGDMHDVSVQGYGEENGQKYWIIRNSWGSSWADFGVFKLIRGIDNLGVESQGCAWAVPKV